MLEDWCALFDACCLLVVVFLLYDAGMLFLFCFVSSVLFAVCWLMAVVCCV